MLPKKAKSLLWQAFPTVAFVPQPTYFTLLLPPLPVPSAFRHPVYDVTPMGIDCMYDCRVQFTLQPSLPGAATPGSNAGDCDIKVREASLGVGAAYNELEEDAEGNGMTADAASLGVSGCGVTA